MIEAGTSQFWRATMALCIGSFMVFANLYITHPLLPMLAEEFEISPLLASWSLMVTTLTLGLSLLVFGPLSDALGRTRLMLMTMCGAVLCSFVLSQVSDFTWLLFWRALQGICLAGLPAIAIAYMGDEFTKKGLIAAVGLYISGNTLGGIGGRLIGGFAGELFGWQEAFALMTFISFLCLCLFVWLLPPSENFSARKIVPTQMMKDAYQHLSNPLLLLAYIVGGLNFFIFINQYSYATFLLADEPYYLSAGVLGLLFLTYLSGTVGAAFSGRIAKNIPQPLVMAMGIIVLMAGTLLTLQGSLWAIILGFLVSAFGFFLAHSCASSWVSHTALHARATASSIYLVFYYLGASSGGFYLDPFWHSWGWDGVVFGSLVILLITLLSSLMLYYKTSVKLERCAAGG
ncbi:MFS transporter [Neptuniibacter sp. QD29_5]|uniref:MFS transporter n=1 Tax=Neptuniibacter sp. QD29_5 TaxID=3398207 RepID=UPI0039F4DCAC